MLFEPVMSSFELKCPTSGSRNESIPADLLARRAETRMRQAGRGDPAHRVDVSIMLTCLKESIPPNPGSLPLLIHQRLDRLALPFKEL